MKKSLLVATLLAAAFAAQAQSADTLKKIKDTGTVVMGVRGSSGALSYTLGEGKYVGYHVELCQRSFAAIATRCILINPQQRWRESQIRLAFSQLDQAETQAVYIIFARVQFRQRLRDQRRIRRIVIVPK